MSVATRRKRFSREEVDQMEDAGLFVGERLELLDGDLVDKMGQLPPHAYVIQLLQALLFNLFGPMRVRIQAPLEMGLGDRKWNLPEPDIAVIKVDSDEFKTRFPGGDEALLVIEVADTSLRTDLTTKRDLYARAGVPEYWVVDVSSMRVIVHRNPNNGAYSEISAYAESENILVPSTNQRVPVTEVFSRKSKS